MPLKVSEELSVILTSDVYHPLFPIVPRTDIEVVGRDVSIFTVREFVVSMLPALSME